MADVRVNAADAVRVELERREDAAVVVPVPYRRSRPRKVTFGQISGGNGENPTSDRGLTAPPQPSFRGRVKHIRTRRADRAAAVACPGIWCRPGVLAGDIAGRVEMIVGGSRTGARFRHLRGPRERRTQLPVPASHGQAPESSWLQSFQVSHPSRRATGLKSIPARWGRSRSNASGLLW